MRTPLLAFLLLSLGTATAAQGTCATRVAQLVSDGESATLAALFRQGDGGTRRQAEELSAKAGRLSALADTTQPRFSQSVRLSVLAPQPPASYVHRSLRVNADSAMLGPVQLHLAVQPETDCTLLALHLEHDPRGRQSGAEGAGAVPTARPVIQVYL
jgi:hypothetical protein